MRKINAAVIGLGKIGLEYDFDEKRVRPSSHTMAYHMNEQINLEAVMDVRAEQRLKLGKIGIETNFYTDMNTLLRRHHLDVISICTPPEQHFQQIMTILENSSAKIIFCEKPLVRNLDEALCLQRYMKDKKVTIITNISRRWNVGMEEVQATICDHAYGFLEKIHVRYTRGIYNTGAHVFDLLHWWCGKMQDVEVLKKVYTTSALAKEPTFTFAFNNENNSSGFFEAFNDENYYLFEIDLYFSKGKIEVRSSGDEVLYYKIAPHHLFSEFNELQLEKERCNLLSDAALENAVHHLVDVFNEVVKPKCTLENAIYPLYVAKALEKSFQERKVERIEAINE